MDLPGRCAYCGSNHVRATEIREIEHSLFIIEVVIICDWCKREDLPALSQKDLCWLIVNCGRIKEAILDKVNKNEKEKRS